MCSTLASNFSQKIQKNILYLNQNCKREIHAKIKMSKISFCNNNLIDVEDKIYLDFR